MSTITARPITGPAAWHGSDLAQSTDWIRPISAAAVAELDAALEPCQSSRPGLARHHARRLPASRIRRRARRDRRRARARPRARAPARPARRALQRGRASPALLGHRDPSGCRALPERARRADRRGARRAPRVRRRRPARRRAEGRRAGDLALQGALERAATLPHRSRGRGRPALRASGAGRRREQDRQLRGDQQRDPRAPARSAHAPLSGLLPDSRG